MKTPIHAVTMLVILFVFCWLMIERAKADDLFGGILSLIPHQVNQIQQVYGKEMAL